MDFIILNASSGKDLFENDISGLNGTVGKENVEIIPFQSLLAAFRPEIPVLRQGVVHVVF
jgi:hypothetical protein